MKRLGWMTLLALAACAESTGGGPPDASRGKDSAPDDAGPCGDTFERCCTGAVCRGELVCTAGKCSPPSSSDAAVDSGCAYSLCEGLCTDTLGDPHNCGSCKHDCQGTLCSMGTCLARGIVSGNQPVGLAVDSTNVYFTDKGGGVYKALSGGGAALELASGFASPYGVTYDSTYVYFTDQGSVVSGYVDGGVYRAPIAMVDGGASQPIATSRTLPQAIAVDDTNVYWLEVGTTTTSGALLACPIAGCPSNTPTVLASSLAVPYGLAIDDLHLYVTNTASGDVLGVAKAGGKKTLVAMGQDGPEGIAVANGLAYWANQGGGLIMAAPIGGGGAEQFIATTMGAPQSVAADHLNVYWSDTSPRFLFGPVNSCAIAGCPPDMPVVLVGQDQTATNIAIDDLFVYWIGAGGQILRVAK